MDEGSSNWANTSQIQARSWPVSPVPAPSHGPFTWSSCLHSQKQGGRANIPASLHLAQPSQAKWSHPSVWKGQWLWHGDSASPDNPLISKFKLSSLIPITQGSGLWAAPATPFIFITETFSPAAGNKGDYPETNDTERERERERQDRIACKTVREEKNDVSKWARIERPRDTGHEICQSYMRDGREAIQVRLSKRQTAGERNELRTANPRLLLLQGNSQVFSRL